MSYVCDGEGEGVGEGEAGKSEIMTMKIIISSDMIPRGSNDS